MLKPSIAFVLSMSVAGCASDSSTGPGDREKGDGAPSAHAAAIQACEDTREAAAARAHDVPTAHAAILAFHDCLNTANQAAAPLIENIIGKPQGGSVAAQLAAADAASKPLCELMARAVDTGDEWRASLLPACLAARTMGHSKLIDAYVQFGDSQVIEIQPSAEVAFDCFDAYETAVEARSDMLSMIEAQGALNDCIDMEVDRYAAADVAERLVDEGMVESAAKMQLVGAITKARNEADEVVCELAVAANSEAGGSIGRLTRLECSGNASWQLVGLLKTLIPE